MSSVRVSFRDIERDMLIEPDDVVTGRSRARREESRVVTRRRRRCLERKDKRKEDATFRPYHTTRRFQRINQFSQLAIFPPAQETRREAAISYYAVTENTLYVRGHEVVNNRPQRDHL